MEGTYGNRSQDSSRYGVESAPGGNQHLRDFQTQAEPAQASPIPVEKPAAGAIKTADLPGLRSASPDGVEGVSSRYFSG